ncbi:Glutathione S-transferase-like protein ustS [Mycena sanguinolenta]|uniref:Glutathione S-transferase-like protein ustS n=1 Tax=Mycena sanguinolenta TaxID=230812 RepID=A0A8H6WXX2_9AGAR|nr:Glutathione S-transferase-like protein ustS [Mycena sanguinolenta]
MARSSRPMPPVITLYDSPGSGSQTWVPAIWRIRLILNYKRLPYRTVWVQFPDVEPTLRALGAPPSSRRPDGRPVYTLPVVVDATRNPRVPQIVSNANSIAEYLESTYPARPVFPEGSRALQTLFVHYIQDVFVKPLLPIMVPVSYGRLPNRSQTHFHGASAPSHPLPLSPGPERERAWQRVKMQFDFLAIVLEKNASDGDGVVAQGHHLSYADFALCAILLWIEQIAPQDGWARIRDWNGGRWARLRHRCQDYVDVL